MASSDLNRTIRRRAVRLTGRGLQVLVEAIDRAWQRLGRDRKITWEDRAQLLHVSVVTTRKILAGDGVDRSTLVLAFEKIGTPWRESFCEFVAEPTVTVAVQAPVPTRKRLNPRKLAWSCGVGVGLFVVVLWISGARPTTEGYGPEVDYGGTLYERATKEYHAGAYDDARKHIGEAVRIARKNQHVALLANAQFVAGMLATETGDYKEADAYYTEVANLRRALREESKMPPIWLQIAEVKARRGQLASAKLDLKSSLQGYAISNDPTGVAMAARDLGSVCFKQGNLGEADHWFKVALKSVSAENKPDIVADIHGRQALVLRARGRFTEARSLAQSALVYWQGRGIPRWVAKATLDLATIECAAQNYGQAQVLLEKSGRLYESVGDRPGVEECKSWLAKSKIPPARLAAAPASP